MDDARWDELVTTTTAVLEAVARRRSTITYQRLREALEAPDLDHRGPHDLAALLRTVSVRSDDADRGLLSALVVQEGNGMPGGGFFRLAAARGRTSSDPWEVWRAEVADVYEGAAHA